MYEFRIACTVSGTMEVENKPPWWDHHWFVRLVNSVYGTAGTATPRDGRLISPDDGGHQGLTTRGVWTGPECVSDGTSLANPTVNRHSGLLQVSS